MSQPPVVCPPTLARCGHCGYWLRGLPPEGRCPECGREYVAAKVVLLGWRTYGHFESRGKGLFWAILTMFPVVAMNHLVPAMRQINDGDLRGLIVFGAVGAILLALLLVHKTRLMPETTRLTMDEQGVSFDEHVNLPAGTRSACTYFLVLCFLAACRTYETSFGWVFGVTLLLVMGP